MVMQEKGLRKASYVALGAKGPENESHQEHAIDALYERGLVWLAEARAEYGAGGQESGRARLPKTLRPFGVTGLDDLLPDGGFATGTAHELYVESDLKRAPSAIVSAISATLLKNLKKDLGKELCSASPSLPPKLALWIGRATWPTPHFLDHIFYAPLSESVDTLPSLSPKAYSHDQPSGNTKHSSNTTLRCDTTLRSRCLFIDPPNEKLLLWSIDTALRSPAVGVVVANLNKLSFPLSQRLTLAARTGNTIGLFYRPLHKGGLPKDTPTAFTTRWLIRPEVSMTAHPRWTIELLKYKGSAPRKTTWSVELCGSDDDQNVPLHLSPPVADRRRASEASGESERSRQRA